jgi:hypothetical protein
VRMRRLTRRETRREWSEERQSVSVREEERKRERGTTTNKRMNGRPCETGRARVNKRPERVKGAPESGGHCYLCFRWLRLLRSLLACMHHRHGSPAGGRGHKTSSCFERRAVLWRRCYFLKVSDLVCGPDRVSRQT